MMRSWEPMAVHTEVDHQCVVQNIEKRSLTAGSILGSVLSAEGSRGYNTANTTSADGDGGGESALRLTCDVVLQISKDAWCVGST
jgi:hypothetical protein